MYKKTLLDLVESFGAEYTWLYKLNVWLYKVGEKTVLTSDKGYAFVVDDVLNPREINNKAIPSENSFSAWIYYTSEKSLIFIEGYGVFISEDSNETARFVSLDENLAAWINENCPCWLHLLLDSESISPQVLMFEGVPFLESNFKVENTLPSNVPPLVVSKNENGFDILTSPNEDKHNTWWNLRNAFSVIKSKELTNIPCVVLDNYNHMFLPSKKLFLETISGRAWYTIESQEDLKVVGHELENALSNEGFAMMYSEKMNLYFLLNEDKNKVLINASFKKEDNSEGMIVGLHNASFDSAFESDVQMLRKKYQDNYID